MAIPIRDALLLPYSTNVDTLINASPSSYGLVAEQGLRYTGLHDLYAAAYQALLTARAQGTQSKMHTLARDTTKRDLLVYAREIYALVAANQQVDPADKVRLGVHVRSGGPTPTPRPTAQPGMDILATRGRSIETVIHDSASAAKRGKPAGAVQALVYYFAGEDYPSDEHAWRFAGPATKAKFTFAVPESVAAGSRVWVCAAWTNRAGEAGPRNEPVSVNIPGGGSSASTAALKIAA